MTPAWLRPPDPRGRVFSVWVEALTQIGRKPAAGGGAGSTPFVLAVPSKGRLQENAEGFFTRAGLALAKPRGARDYRGTINGLDHVEIRLSVGERNAWQLARGALLHLGVTGEGTWCAKAIVGRRQARVADRPFSASAAPMSWSRGARRPGSTSAPWPISTTSPPDSAPSIEPADAGWRPNTSI